MFKLINDSLFTVRSTEESNDYGPFIRTEVCTSKYVVSNIVRDRNSSTQNTRTLLRIVCPTKDYNNFNHSLTSKQNENGNVSVLLKSDTKNHYDSNVIAIAFPFNGIVRPIAESKQYRIRKGMIIPSSEYSIMLNGKKYNKILYLIIEPHMNLFAEDHKYHTDEISIDLESFCYVKDRNTSEQITTKEHMKVIITKDNVTSTWNSMEVDPIDVSEFRESKLFITYNQEAVNKYKSEGDTAEVPVAPNHRFMYSGSKTPSIDNSVTSTSRTIDINVDNVQTEAPVNRSRNNTSATNSNTYRGKPNTYHKDEQDDARPGKRVGNKGKRSKKKYN